MTTPVIAYKGFHKDLTCNGFQYEVGKTYKHDGPVERCEQGFHACESPLDVWAYYGVTESRFAIVEMSGKLDREKDGDTKIAAAEITIKAELTLPEFIKRGVEWLIEATKGKKDSSSGHYAQIGSSGDYARIEATGKNAVIASAGHNAIVRGAGGAWVSVAEFNDKSECVGFATGCIGKNGLKPNTWYRAEGGKLVEAA
jgi:hypothetical protein